MIVLTKNNNFITKMTCNKIILSNNTLFLYFKSIYIYYMIHICTNCYKTFKTVQHLNQHKNRKHKCKPFTEDNLNLSSIQSKTLPESKNDNNKLENGIISVNHSYHESNNDEGGFISPNICTMIESKDVNSSIDNLSVTNLLEFVGNHKKLLEEKNKLENALIILKKHLESLSKENTDLKNKITVVNDFISSYKSSEGIIKI
jgi:hypothetical protein